MKNKDRKLSVCWSRHGKPQILSAGDWLGGYGFTPGDQVTVSNPEPGIILMKVTTPAVIMNVIRERRDLQCQINRLKKDRRLSPENLKELTQLESRLHALPQEIRA